MNAALRKAVKAAIVSGAGALAIASVMISHPAGLEGVRYTAYRDVAGVPTVCYGHTGPDVKFNIEYSEAECRALLDKDLAIVAKGIDPLIHVTTSEPQRAALYTFAYNVGVAAFAKSTLLRLLNAGEYMGACQQIRRWVYAAGVVWKGLVSRREVETEVCEWGSKRS